MEWQRSRALVKRTFSRFEVGNFDVLGFHIRRFLDLLRKDGSDVDLQPLLSRLVSFLSLQSFLLLPWWMSVANLLGKVMALHNMIL